MCGGYIGCQSNCCSFIGNLSYWLLLIFSLSVQQGHHGMFRHGFMNSFCSGFGVLIHSDNSFLPFRKILRFCLFSLFLKLISDVCEISFYLLFLVSQLLSLFLSVQCSRLSPCFFSLSSLIFFVQFVSKLPIECGCLICMQGSNYGITCEYSSVTIIQVRREVIACSLE